MDRREPEQASPGAFPVGKLLGVQINIEPSLLFLFLIVAFGLGSSLFPAWHPGWSFVTRWATALLAAGVFLLSILLHEMAHAVVARLYGLEVKSITLFMFGGLAGIEREPPSPTAELLMAIVGPITSLVIGLLALFAGGTALGMTPASLDNPALALSQLGPAGTLLLWLGPVNIGLGLFNMIPGFPLDGGRVLRALLWLITGNLKRATRWAAWGGQLVGYLLMAAGLAMVFGARIPLLGTGFGSGIWLMLLGFMLSNAARASYAQMVVRGVLEGIPVARLMRRDVPAVSPTITVAALVDRLLFEGDERTYAVVDNEKLVGMVALDDVRKISRERWGDTPVSEVMTPASQLTVATPEEDAFDALKDLGQRGVRQLPVVSEGSLLGVVRLRDLMRFLELQSDRDLSPTGA